MRDSEPSSSYASRITYLILGVGFLAQVVSYSEYARVGIDYEVLAGDTATNDLVSNLPDIEIGENSPRLNEKKLRDVCEKSIHPT